MFLSHSPELDTLLRGIILSISIMLWIILLIRINGLRSFSKMTSFDFVMTIANGSLLAGASQATDWIGFFQPLIAMTTLFLVQFVTAFWRIRSDIFESIVQNEPILLMLEGEILEQALKKTRVARSDLLGKLREANIIDISEVRAVILETTGDISVLTGKGELTKVLAPTQRIDQ